MKRIYLLSQLFFTGFGLAFFVLLHFSRIILLRFPDSLAMGGLVFFGIGLVPMWIVVVFSIVNQKGKGRENWLERMIADLPRPVLTKKLFMIFWNYTCLFFGLSVVLSGFKEGWGAYLSIAGRPCIFIAFYGVGFLCAWANWRKASRADPSTSSE
jgi:hypothetical protein